MSDAREAIDRCSRGLGYSEAERASLAAFTSLLARHGRRANLVGTTDVARIADEIVVDSTRLAGLLDAPSGELVDVGAGAGIPIIPLLLVLPGWTGVAVEPRQKRREFMRVARRSLELGDRLEIFDGRIDEEGHVEGLDRQFDLAVTKAVFAPDEWVARAADLIRAGGHIGVFSAAGAEPSETVQAFEYSTLSGSRRVVSLV